MYEIPKLEVPVEINLINNESLNGKMFITEDLISPASNPEIEEFLNQEDNFITVYQHDQKLTMNRNQIVYVNAN